MRCVLSTLVRCSTKLNYTKGERPSLGCQDSNLHLRLKGQEKWLLVEMRCLLASVFDSKYRFELLLDAMRWVLSIVIRCSTN